MLSSEAEQEALLKLVESKKPKSVKELVSIAEKELGYPPEKTLKHVKALRDAGKLVLREPSLLTLGGYLFSKKSAWFWAVLAWVFATDLAMLLIPGDSPAAPIRWVLGFVYILFIPGYCFMNALYPSRDELDDIEFLTLSIGMSLAITPLSALIAQYVTGEINLYALIYGLSLISLLFAASAVVEKYDLEAGRPVWPKRLFEGAKKVSRGGGGSGGK